MNSISQTQVTMNVISDFEKDVYTTINKGIAVAILLRCEVVLELNGVSLYLNPMSDVRECVITYKNTLNHVVDED
jgi:hypothetical protein